MNTENLPLDTIQFFYSPEVWDSILQVAKPGKVIYLENRPIEVLGIYDDNFTGYWLRKDGGRMKGRPGFLKRFTNDPPKPIEPMVSLITKLSSSNNSIDLTFNPENRTHKQLSYRELMDWKKRDNLGKLSFCPFCVQEMIPVHISAEVLVALTECRIHNALFETTCIGAKKTHQNGTDTITYTMTASLDRDGQTLLYGRPSCSKCDGLNKINKYISRFERSQKAMKSGDRRREQILNTQEGPIDRMEIFRRDHGICHLCHRPVAPNSFHLDHVIPLAKGGTHTKDNLRLAHPSCNISKATKTTEMFQSFAEEEIARYQSYLHGIPVGFAEPKFLRETFQEIESHLIYGADIRIIHRMMKQTVEKFEPIFKEEKIRVTSFAPRSGISHYIFTLKRSQLMLLMKHTRTILVDYRKFATRW